ncbi:EAL and HDOD domain-containing protein [Desulfobulbus elongatus]|uniref:EAL and HDOD domain-containing protein n=1 Tax=Desulfobulbus elongatus TaxID=53332 RepID=UPI00048409E8|nr:HDOD domain-containing protein [Desulfobulbus elongatus]
MDVYIARQPIFDRQRRLFAYEVLYRSSMDNAFPEHMNSDEATHTVLAHVLFNIGLDAITGRHRALINFTENHLLQKTPIQLPRKRCIVEILESILPSPSVFAACKELKEQGYTLALDDFDFNEQSAQLIPSVHIVKVDLQAADRERLTDNMARMRCYPGVAWLAEKIESYQEFQLALSLGFSYFQGYFLDKPEVLKNRTIDTSKIVLLNLLAEVCRPEVDLRRIERLVSPDVSLSYKLFRYINSAYYSLVRKVSSVRYALAYLGESGVRQFISLAAASEISVGKPSELMRLSMIRAQLCQLLAELGNKPADGSQLFLLGLFSLLDAMLDMPMAELTAKLPLTDGLKNALDKRTGPLAPYLQAVAAYERGEFHACADFLRQLGIAPEAMIDAYLKALAWADQFDASIG